MRNSSRVSYKSIVSILGGALLASVALHGATAGSTLVRFSGEIDSISSGYEIPGIFIGDKVSGVLSFNPATIDDQPLNWIGHYPNAIERFDVTIGSRVFSMTTSESPASEIDIINDDYYSETYHDSMLFRIAVNESVDPDVVRFFQLTFSTAAATPPSVLSGDALPENPDLAAFDVRKGFITYMPPGASQGSNFTLTNVEVTPISEPRDLTGDGKADIVLRNIDTGYLFMWAMDSNLKTYLDISPLALNREVVEIADLTGDGKADLLLRNKDNGYVYMWQMDGNLKTYLGIGSLALNKEVVGIGDLTGDGKADIVLRNKDNGYLFMWQMDGNLKTYLGISSLALNREVVGIADLTGDGKADIVLRNKDNNYLYMWRMDGNLKTYYGIGSLGPDRKLVQASDLSGDGKADLVLRNTVTGYMELWEMDGNLVTAKAIGPLALSREVQPSAVPSPVPAVDAVDDAATTASDMAATLSVLSNDKPNPAALSISTLTQPANGVVVDNGDGTLSYSQNGLAKESVGMGLYKTYCKSCHNVGGFSGTDTFSYVASDGQTNDSATVTVTVNSFDPPGPWDDGGNISGSPISVCNDLPHSCKAKSDAEIQSIGRFLGEVFAP